MLRISMERDRDDNFELLALKRRHKSLSLNRERFGHVSTEEAIGCSRGVVPKNSEKNDCCVLNVLGCWLKLMSANLVMRQQRKPVCVLGELSQKNSEKNDRWAFNVL